jgi:hypothetical protein
VSPGRPTRGARDRSCSHRSAESARLPRTEGSASPPGGASFVTDRAGTTAKPAYTNGYTVERRLGRRGERVDRRCGLRCGDDGLRRRTAGGFTTADGATMPPVPHRPDDDLPGPGSTGLRGGPPFALVGPERQSLDAAVRRGWCPSPGESVATRRVGGRRPDPLAFHRPRVPPADESTVIMTLRIGDACKATARVSPSLALL